MFKKTAIIGLGLIGASIAQAMIDRGLTTKVVACDKSESDLAIALADRLIVAGFTDVMALFDAHGDVDLIVLAVPTGAMADILATLAELKQNGKIRTDTIITDVASTKANVYQAVLDVCQAFDLPNDFLNFVPSHPIAGAENSGVQARNGKLFEHREFIICQDDIATAQDIFINKIKILWQAIGATVSIMTSQKHDEILSLTSHLPHLLSYALTYQLAKDDESLNIFRYAAGGFRDFSRISASSPIMWHDIFIANKEQVLKGLDNYQKILDELKADIENENSDKLLETFKTAKNAREYFGNLLIKKEQAKMMDFSLEKFTLERSQELFELTNKNRDYLKRTLPWLDAIKTADDTIDFIKKCIELDNHGKGLHYFIMSNHKIIGVINLRDMSQESALVGYWIDENEQGKNITSQALMKLIELVKYKKLTNKIILRAGVENIGSNKVALKCGFKFKYTLANHENLYGKLIDLNIYELPLIA